MISKASSQAIGNHTSNAVAKDSCNCSLRCKNAGLPIFQSTELEEEEVVAHDTPWNGAKDTLHDHDAEGGNAQETQHSAKLCADCCATLYFGGLIELVMGLGQEQCQASCHNEGNYPCPCEQKTPPWNVSDIRICNIASNQQGAEHANEQCTLHTPKDFATSVVTGEVRNQAIADWTEGCQEETTHATQQHHHPEVWDKGKDGHSNSFSNGSKHQNGLPFQSTTICKDTPEGRSQVRQNHLHGEQHGKVTQLQTQVPLQGKLASRNQLGIHSLQTTHTAKPKEDDGAWFTLFLHLWHFLHLLLCFFLYFQLLALVGRRGGH
mmetsp:Transcript_24097/g.29456  ORF Transcript_24097/g.29456 Transcript_24097/m.29456 type:complete len:321 (-) Transcript_24097:71-1033(-)